MVPVLWFRPPPGCLKINTDGAARGRTGESSCGGVIRDFNGVIFGAFCEFLGHETSVEAELHGVIRAIDMVWSLGLHLRYRIWLESDSMQVVKLVQNHSKEVPLSVRDKWAETLERLKKMQCPVTHIYREGNSVADKLANFAIDSGHVSCAWQGAPDFVLHEAQLDACGLVRFRTKPVKGFNRFCF